MEAYQWIHPGVAIATLLLISVTAWSKMRSRKFFRLHYILASATVPAVLLTLGLAVYTVLRCDCDDDWPVSLYVHLVIALLLTLFVLGQATMGVSMLLFGRRPRLFRVHRFNARIVMGLAGIVLLLGVTTATLLLVQRICKVRGGAGGVQQQNPNWHGSQPSHGRSGD